MNLLRTALLAACLSAVSLTTYAAPDRPASVLTNPTADEKYEQVIHERTAKIVDALDITEDAKKQAVHEIIQTQYRSLNTWHETNDKRRDELRKVVGKSTEATPEKQELDRIDASLREIHDWYLAALAEHLTPEQVDTVKDKMVYGKVQVTYNGYLAQQPNLTEEEKAYLLDQLKQAREEGMDGASTEEKNKIFDKYKGRINNWLVKRGYHLSGKKPATKPSTQPAK
jgi:Spy/CpxP family protein refolding chaperone